ncbi:hypothetical protein LRP52_49535 [Photobacterium sp. ZSDE20]|uniref:Uncharacterized protein n=1 Tax=Photobacterium pectinilyticum TaxID=2906793 RepID=A0ABT1NDH9_9GAMM|nr:hypothetical protein [Photobacterium sp. ZSDE20]MCQ1061404.1 hypothetical protein [Photobacterium sp. ZSDE20]MDD1830180.1 hypothetical protein [Photobacterium sp. ZSDE20]
MMQSQNKGQKQMHTVIYPATKADIIDLKKDFTKELSSLKKEVNYLRKEVNSIVIIGYVVLLIVWLALIKYILS